MIIIRFPDEESKRRALGCLPGRYPGKSWTTGEMMVPEDALGFLTPPTKLRRGDAVEGGGGERRGVEVFDGTIGRGGERGEGGPRAARIRGALETVSAPGMAGEAQACFFGPTRSTGLRAVAFGLDFSRERH